MDKAIENKEVHMNCCHLFFAPNAKNLGSQKPLHIILVRFLMQVCGTVKCAVHAPEH